MNSYPSVDRPREPVSSSFENQWKYPCGEKTDQSGHGEADRINATEVYQGQPSQAAAKEALSDLGKHNLIDLVNSQRRQLIDVVPRVGGEVA
ncbi:MAG: hypothetical protein ACPGFB_11310 [Verrucomicrobiales bacterium]